MSTIGARIGTDPAVNRRVRSAALVIALSLGGCGAEAGDDGASPREQQAKGAYACMSKHEQRRYDALRARHEKAVDRFLERHPGATRAESHRDPHVAALKSALDAAIDEHAPEAGEECGEVVSP